MRKKEEKEEEEEEGFREKKTAMSRCLENLISCAHARSRRLARAYVHTHTHTHTTHTLGHTEGIVDGLVHVNVFAIGQTTHELHPLVVRRLVTREKGESLREGARERQTEEKKERERERERAPEIGNCAYIFTRAAQVSVTQNDCGRRSNRKGTFFENNLHLVCCSINKDQLSVVEVLRALCDDQFSTQLLPRVLQLAAAAAARDA